MKTNCNVIIDLMPLYKEDLCSPESRELVEDHLRNCEDCRQLFEMSDSVKEEAVPVPAENESFRKVNRALKIRKFYKVAAVLLCVVFAAWVILSIGWIFTKYLPYKEYCSGMQKIDPRTGNDNVYYCQDEEFAYDVDCPDYLHFTTGVMLVNFNDTAQAKEKYSIKADHITLVIKPALDGKVHYEVHINHSDMWAALEIDKSLNFIPNGKHSEQSENPEKFEAMIAEDHDAVQALMDAAQKQWGDKLNK